MTNIEAKLDEYFSIIETMPTEFVEQAEKAKEKERRQRAREEKLEQQKREQERRVQRSLERAQAPVMKKTGKPVAEIPQGRILAILGNPGPGGGSMTRRARAATVAT